MRKVLCMMVCMDTTYWTARIRKLVKGVIYISMVTPLCSVGICINIFLSFVYCRRDYKNSYFHIILITHNENVILSKYPYIKTYLEYSSAAYFFRLICNPQLVVLIKQKSSYDEALINVADSFVFNICIL